MEKLYPILLQQTLLVQLGFVLLSILGLWKGSDLVIDGCKSIARKLGISEMVIGLTVVSIGSSFPEIFVNIAAGIRGADDVGVGNVIGSCFVQISMILGLCILIAGAMKEERATIRRDGGMLLGSIILLFLFSLDKQIQNYEAVIMLTLYACYITYLIGYHDKKKDRERKKSKKHLRLATFQFLAGAFLVWLSADILIHIGIHAGEEIGMSQSLIGLLSGIGTSIPELVVSLVALLKKSQGISVGNILGSNITDPLLSLPLGAFLAGGYQVDAFFITKAIPAWFLVSSLVVCVFYVNGSIGRKWATSIMAFYLMFFFFVS